MSMFKPAVKHESKLRLAIAGPSGAGKTYTSLAIATSLANGGKVAVVDTEHGSAEKYSGIFPFDVLTLDAPFHPDRFSEAIQMAAQEGYSVVVLDSLSHAWNGAGGALELVEQFSRRYKGNSYAAWGDVTPIQNRLIESIVGAKLHVIATMRSKQDYILIDRNGKQMPQKVGMAPIQRDGFEYEFDVFLDMDVENNAVVTKTRCPELTGKVINKPGVDLANTLRSWLSGEPMPEFKAQPTRQPVTPNGKPAPSAEATTMNQHNATGIRGDELKDTPPDPPVTVDADKVAMWREKVSKNSRPTVGTVCSAIGYTGLYTNEQHAINTANSWRDGLWIEDTNPSKTNAVPLHKDDALELFDWLVARKQVAKQPALIDAAPATAYAE